MTCFHLSTNLAILFRGSGGAIPRDASLLRVCVESLVRFLSLGFFPYVTCSLSEPSADRMPLEDDSDDDSDDEWDEDYFEKFEQVHPARG